MKKSTSSLLLTLLALLVAGCASDVNVGYPYPQAPAETGSILVKLTNPARQVHVQVDGALVVEEAHTERVVIQDVPVGPHQLEVAADGARETVQRDVVVEPGRETAVLVSISRPGAPFLLYTAAMIGLLMSQDDAR